MTTQYRMPAEWERQSATWVSWPHNAETWPDNLSEAREEFAAFVAMIAATQPVNVLAGGQLEQAENCLRGIANVELIDLPTNDAWARDYAPTFVVDQENRELVAIDWHYNAWGAKYPPFDDDQQVAKLVARNLGIRCISPDLCFEGGALEVSQNGLMLCTRSCAFDPNRNPAKSQTEIEQIFRDCLGIKQIVWLTGDAIEGDDTDGHIDQLARFTDNRTIVYAWTDDATDLQYRALSRNLTELKNEIAGELGEYRLIALPIPGPIFRSGRRVPASYCNFLICNEIVIVPQFEDPRGDERALEILEPLFPGRRVVGLSSINLAVGLGSFHCLSQQQPEVNENSKHE